MWFSALLYLPFSNFPPTQACHLYFLISFIFLSVTTTTTTTTTTIPLFPLYLINYKHTWKRNIYIYIYIYSVVLQFRTIRNSTVAINDQWLLLKPELLWLLIINALQLNELSALRNTFYPEYKYIYIYIYIYLFVLNKAWSWNYPKIFYPVLQNLKF